MTRWVAALVSGLLSMALSGFSPDDPSPAKHAGDEPGTKSDSNRNTEVRKRIEVRALGLPAAEPAIALGQTYDTLRRLRAEKLEGRGQELLERATELYRRGVEAYAKNTPESTREAGRLASAARELARAVDRLNEVRRGDRPDPDLPAPPAPRGLPGVKGLSGVPGLPGSMPFNITTGPDGIVTGRMVVGSPDGKAKGDARVERRIIVTGPDGKILTDNIQGKPDEDHVIILKTPGAVGGIAVPDVKLLREKIGGELEVQIDEKKLKELTSKLEGRARAAAEAASRSAEAAARTAEAVTREFHIVVGADAPDRAQTSLELAHKRITEDMAKAKTDEDRFYLNAAKELYNAARKDAEAGRMERASELARAAVALTMVPKHLAGKDEEASETEKKVERRVRVEVRDDDKGDKDEKDEKDDADQEAKKKIERRVRVEVRGDDAKPDSDKAEEEKAEEEKATDDQKPVGGLGLKFSFADEVLEVLEVLPDSPAAKDGRIKPGDVLLGVEREGRRVDFKDREREEIVELLRGEPGSKVRVIVRHEGGDEDEVLELTRSVIKLPAPEDASREAAPPQRELPPAIP